MRISCIFWDVLVHAVHSVFRVKWWAERWGCCRLGVVGAFLYYRSFLFININAVFVFVIIAKNIISILEAEAEKWRCLYYCCICGWFFLDVVFASGGWLTVDDRALGIFVLLVYVYLVRWCAPLCVTACFIGSSTSRVSFVTSNFKCFQIRKTRDEETLINWKTL